MPENILRLNTLVADCLKEIHILKNSVARDHQYEKAAKLRDVEKQFEKCARDILSFSHPLVPTKGLTVNGKFYSNQLFRYAQGSHWKNIPQNIIDLLKSRKTHFNGLISFTDAGTQKLIALNIRLTDEEKRIEDFLNFVNTFVSSKAIRTAIGNLSFGSITIKCYTNSDCYEAHGNGFGIKTPFYEFEIPVVDLSNNIDMNSDSDDNDSTVQNFEFLDTLPINFRDEKICFVFSLLANNGLLAWDDMLNIDRLSISLPFDYRFQET